MKRTFTIFLCAILFPWHVFSQEPAKPNIIFIVLDDLNEYLQGFTTQPQVYSKNINAIAKAGTSFENAHCSAPVCSPSRTSFLTGKDCYYTQVYTNSKCVPFRDQFTAAKGNEVVFTLPQYLKDSGGYFTYNIGKVFDCHSDDYDFDFSTTDDCSRQLSWSKYYAAASSESSSVLHYGDNHNAGVNDIVICAIPDSMEDQTNDYAAVDSALNFLRAYEQYGNNTCGKPFALFLGLRKPHAPLYIPQKYFLSYYDVDYHDSSFVIPYNTTPVAPYNGVVMPPQPFARWNDYYELPSGGLGRWLADIGGIEDSVETYFDPLDSVYPWMQDSVSEDERLAILQESLRANMVMAYIAAVRFADAQIGRLYQNLKHNPDVLNNTIIVILSDNGFHLGEKRHWSKATLWEPSLRGPLIISDFRNPHRNKVYKQVSLLDLFPTMCDLAAMNPPLFPDSTKYLDGVSLVPLMSASGVVWDHPAIASFENIRGNQLACYPQYSVKDNEFHYIRYQSNNAGFLKPCSAPASYFEKELYDVGELRNIDPHEWNNLINDSAYAGEVAYLEQFLPGGSMYLMRAIPVENSVTDYPCFFTSDDVLHASAKVSEDILENSVIEWKFPDGKILRGNDIQENIKNICSPALLANDKFSIDLQIIDTLSNKISGFKKLDFYAGNTLAPETTWSTSVSAQGILQIRNVNITGNYKSIEWDFGDGMSDYGKYPLTHRYEAPGNYQVRMIVHYGNSDCNEIFTKEIHYRNESASDFATVLAYPNPVSSVTNIYLPSALFRPEITIFDITGQRINSFFADAQNSTILSFDAGNLAAGFYIVRIREGAAIYQCRVDVVH